MQQCGFSAVENEPAHRLIHVPFLRLKTKSAEKAGHQKIQTGYNKNSFLKSQKSVDISKSHYLQ